MIFSVSNHIEQVIAGTKTQTRRKSNWYQVGKTYSVQPCRTCKGIPEGRILITKKRSEFQPNVVSREDAEAEGGYTSRQFEELYRKMDPNWRDSRTFSVRYAYSFRFVPTEEAKG